MLTLRHLTKKFGALAAVDRLSLEVRSGEIFACIGPNGSGKTTTVKMAAGLYMPSAGSIHINNVDLAQEPEKAKSVIGYVPDDPFVYEKMSGREFLGFVGTLYGTPLEIRHSGVPVGAHGTGSLTGRIDQLLSVFPGLQEVIDGFVESYSRGNKQKLAIVAALMHQPKLLLIDEPMVGLDPQSALAVKKLLREFAQQGGVVFLCTHTLPVAEELAHRIGVLEKGKLVAVGTLQELRDRVRKPTASLEEVYLAITEKRETPSSSK